MKEESRKLLRLEEGEGNRSLGQDFQWSECRRFSSALWFGEGSKLGKNVFFFFQLCMAVGKVLMVTYFSVPICSCMISNFQLPAQHRIPESTLLASSKYFGRDERRDDRQTSLLQMYNYDESSRLTSHSLLEILVEATHSELLQCWIR